MASRPQLASTGGWVVVDHHVMPAHDFVPHYPRPDCSCRPTPDPADPRVLIHHAADMREHYEHARPS